MGFSWDLNDFTNQTWDIFGDFSLTDSTVFFLWFSRTVFFPGSF